MLVSGFVSGKIVLWDMVKGVIVKSLDAYHSAPIASVRFFHDLSAIVSVDSRGCVQKLSYSKVLPFSSSLNFKHDPAFLCKTLWMSYNVQTECLLDGGVCLSIPKYTRMFCE